MAKGRASTSSRDKDDSLVVHPATQGASPANDSDAVVVEDGSDSDDQGDSQGFWEAEAIVDETATQYLIAWKGKDENGEAWKPTWEPKENANSLLVKSWLTRGRAEKRAQKAQQKAAKLMDRERRKAKKSKASRSSSRSSTSSAASEPAPLPTKRKMVVSDSEGSSQPQPQPSAKKTKSSDSKGKKKVAFEAALDSEEGTEGEESDVVPDAGKPGKPAELVLVASGEPSLSLVPDSQACVPASQAPAKPEEDRLNDIQLAIGSLAGVDRSPRRHYPQIDSPTTSHSDLEAEAHLPENDDVPIFDPLRPTDRHSSPESEHGEAPRRLGPVPVPPISAFHRHDSYPVSSQLDPIEDPDSSPRRAAPSHHRSLSASPSRAARPAKSCLELVTVEDDSPASSFEAEVQSSAAASYVSLPIDFYPIIPRPGGCTPLRPFASRAPAATATVKRPLARAPSPTPAEGITVGGAATAAVVRRPRSPSIESPERVVEETFFEEEGDDFVQEFIDEFLDLSGGGDGMSEVPSGKAAGEAVDAGEGGYGSNGQHGCSGGASAGAPGGGPPAQGGPSSIPGYIPGPPMNALSGGYGYPAGGAGFPGAPYPPMHLPPSHAAGTYSPAPPPVPVKREYEGDTSTSSKKPRVDDYGRPVVPSPSPAPVPSYPPSAPSPYHAAHTQASVPFQTQPTPSAHSSPYPTHPSPAAPGVPAFNVISPSPVSAGYAPSPSLARVQNLEPAQAPSPTNGRAAPPSPAYPAAAAVAQVPVNSHRSPSPLPASLGAVAAGPPSSPSVFPTAPGLSLSRNSSPAPGGTKVDEVINLVKASPHISDTDGTKAELERFLRDPRAYIANINAPLAREPFWAFELRRHAVDGVEKVDFIIVRSKEGTFQLKRSTADKIPVAFARSLASAAPTAPGLTPAVEAVPTLVASSPAPVAPPAPLAPAQMTREQLEQEVLRLRAKDAANEAELVTLRASAAEAAKLKVDVAALQKQTKQLQASRDSAQQDLVYVQAQYQAASSAAVERASEATAAEAETAKLRVLLDTGLKQKELLHAAKEKRLKIEHKRLIKEVKFYREQQRRTDEREVREKAAKWDDHVAALEVRAKEEASRTAGEAVEEDSPDENDAAMQDGFGAPSSSFITTFPDGSSASMLITNFSGGPAASVPSSSLAQEPSTLSSQVPGLSQLQTQASAVPDFRCEWRVGTDSQAEACGAVCPTKEALHLHVLGHVPSSL
ncbi:hypothetical protein JCM10207_004323 [Rhodosporidiobolus poonsookiae]